MCSLSCMETDPDRWYAFYLSLGRLWRLGLTLDSWVEKLKLKQNKNMFSGIFVVQISGHIIESYQIPSGYILLSFLFSLT